MSSITKASKTILVDVDGVLADFDLGFSSLLYTLDHSISPWSKLDARANDWDMSSRAPKELLEEGWRSVKASLNFWETLPAIPTRWEWEKLEMLCSRHQVVFGTHRMGIHPQRQTSNFLRSHGIKHPSVVLTKRKGDLARTIDADYAIDDKPENVACIHWIADVQPCKAYLRVWPCNKDASLPSRTKCVHGVGQFIDDILKEVS